ncbi:MAG: G protein subunit beta, partial [Paramarteilia canceri]
MACDLSPSSSIVAAGGLNNKTSIYSLHPDRPLVTSPTLELSNTHHMLAACKFLSNNTIVSAHGPDCSITNIERSNSSTRMRCHHGQITGLDRVNKYPHNFVTCSSDRSLRVWDDRMRLPGMKYRVLGELNAVKCCQMQPNILTTCHDNK